MTRDRGTSVSLHLVDEDCSMETTPNAPASLRQAEGLYPTFGKEKKLAEGVGALVLLWAWHFLLQMPLAEE